MTMMKFLHIALVALAMLAGAHKISSVESAGAWVYLYDDTGHKYKTLSASTVGEVKGYSATFMVSQNAHGYSLWTKTGTELTQG